MLDQKLKNQVLDKLIAYLVQRDHSKKELYEKLSRRFAKDEILWALEQAKEFPPRCARPLRQASNLYTIISFFIEI